MYLTILLLIMFDVVLIINTYIIFYIFKELKKTKKDITTPKPVRKHSTIKTSNYNNSFNTRGYDQFKDKKTGLYEPQKPHQGIELKSKKED